MATPLYENGQRRLVQGMAASSIRSKTYALSICDECGEEIAWAQSTKTNKWYLCNVAEYTTEGGHPRHRAIPYSPHFKTCRKSRKQKA